eukprot:scaffold4563_cov101-Isochrysis_galbana.AAC.1
MQQLTLAQLRVPRLLEEGKARLQRGKELVGRRHQRGQVAQERNRQPPQLRQVRCAPAAIGGGGEVGLEDARQLGVEQGAETGCGHVGCCEHLCGRGVGLRCVCVMSGGAHIGDGRADRAADAAPAAPACN